MEANEDAGDLCAAPPSSDVHRIETPRDGAVRCNALGFKRFQRVREVRHP